MVYFALGALVGLVIFPWYYQRKLIKEQNEAIETLIKDLRRISDETKTR